MRVFGLRVSVVLLTFALVMGGALAGGHWLYEQRVHRPLEEVLLGVDHVEAVTVEPAAGLRSLGPTDVRVRLSRDADLERVYARVEGMARQGLGDRLGRIYVEDRRSPQLEDALREMRFAVEEAMATGHYRRMREDIDAVAALRGLDTVRVSMDHRFVYLTLGEEDAYLHHLAAREPARAGTAAPAGIGGLNRGVYSGG